jgi:hypothetical protein
MLAYETFTNGGTVSVAGGNGGNGATGSGTGTSGNSGSAGSNGTTIFFNTSTGEYE